MTFILYLHIELDSICMPIHHQHALTCTIFIFSKTSLHCHY